MKFPISTSQLADFLPHRPPMVWIDEVLSCDDESGEASVVIQLEAHYMTRGKLRPSAIIEFIAQAFGYTAACRHLINSPSATVSIQKAFLVGVRDANLKEVSERSEWTSGERLLVRVGHFKQIGPMQILDGTVLLAATDLAPEKILATANLKLYSE